MMDVFNDRQMCFDMEKVGGRFGGQRYVSKARGRFAPLSYKETATCRLSSSPLGNAGLVCNNPSIQYPIPCLHPSVRRSKFTHATHQRPAFLGANK